MDVSKYLVKNSSITTLCELVGVGVGIVLEAIILATFGVSREMDAFFAASTLPFLLFQTLDAQLPKIIIPYITTHRQSTNEESSNRLMSHLLNFFVVILTGTTLCCMLLQYYFLHWFVPGLKADALELGSSLSISVSWLILIRGMSSVLRSYSISQHKYLMQGTRKVMNTGLAIAVILLLRSSCGVKALVYGYISGALMEMVLLFFSLRSGGFRYRLDWRVGDPEVWRMFKLMTFSLSGHFIFAGRSLVENFFASGLTEGSLSQLRYAYRILTAVMGVLMGGVSMATLPVISGYAAKREFKEIRLAIQKSIQILLLIAAPAGLALFFLTKPLMQLAFQRGKFTAGDADMIAALVGLSVPGIVFGRINLTIQYVFYAFADVVWPWINTLAMALMNALILWALYKWLGIWSFPVAFSGAGLGGLIMIAMLHRKHYGSLEWDEQWSHHFRLALATVVCLGGILAGKASVTLYVHQNLFANVLQLVIPALFGCGFFLIAASQLGLTKGLFPTPREALAGFQSKATRAFRKR